MFKPPEKIYLARNIDKEIYESSKINKSSDKYHNTDQLIKILESKKYIKIYGMDSEMESYNDGIQDVIDILKKEE